jgi:hypothetical protein
MLRRLAGCPAWSEDHTRAKIAAGQVSCDQPEPFKRFR